MTTRLPLLLAIPALLLAGCAVEDPAQSTTSAPPTTQRGQTTGAQTPGSTTAAAGAVTCQYPAAGKPARPADPPPTKDVPATGTLSMTIEMSEGPIQVTMDRSATPCTVNSFESLAKQGFFDDTTCHRLTEKGIFVLQCGDPSGTGRGGPGYRFADEVKGTETYPAGTVAMANSGPGTATNGSQFFLVYQDSPLPAGYTVFGKMDEAGLGVVGRIAAMGHVPPAEGDKGEGKPINDARIVKVTAG